MIEPRAWKFRPGSDEATINSILKSGLISLNYKTLGLSRGMSREDLISKLRGHNLESSDKGIHAHAGQIDTLLNRVTKGDLALVPRERGKLMMIGEIISDYASVSRTLIEVRVRWIAPSVPISRFEQDLRYSFMAIHNFCGVTRNGAPGRIRRISQGEPDPGF